MAVSLEPGATEAVPTAVELLWYVVPSGIAANAVEAGNPIENSMLEITDETIER
jgi:hypothetical protein